MSEEFDQVLGSKLYESLLCEKCLLGCPLGINIPNMIIEARKFFVKKFGPPSFLTKMLKNLNSSGNVFISKKRTVGVPFKKGRDVLFKGCIESAFLREDLKYVRRILDKFNYSYTEIINERCCGYVLEKLGFNNASKIYKENYKMFKDIEAKRIITICPECFEAFKERYPSIIKEFKFKVLSIIDVLLEIFEKAISLMGGLDLEVVYIKSNKEVDKKALELLGKMPKLKVLDEVDGVRCYGINNVNLSLAMNIIKSSVSNLIKSKKFVFVSSSPINVYLFKKALKKYPVAIGSVSELFSLALGI